MSKIKLLNSSLIDQIAAGEVVDRPSSVIKELIENSIDASSNSIEINTNNGGNSLIQVIDNGKGMDKDDLKNAFKRHATSKISSIDDLNHITTLGFRGEALPSIASISMLKAYSAIQSSIGYKIYINGTEEIKYEPSDISCGTKIEINNLFYNVPARRKFLKKPETEQVHINSIVRGFMLAYPNISFILRSNNKIVYDVKKESLSNRIRSIYGSTYYNHILNVKLNKDPYTVQGYIGNLSLVKKRNSEQFIFLNGRLIKNRILNNAIYTAYQTLISRGEYPFYCLNITMPDDYYDVNVHPSKLEVKFKNEWQIHYLLKSAITPVLQDILNVIPNFDLHNNTYNNQNNNETLPFNSHAYENIKEYEQAPHRISFKNNNFQNNNEIIDLNKAQLRMESSFNPEINKSSELKVMSNNIWQIHNKYLLTEIKNGLVIIDQHVAHERILFEEAKSALEGKKFSSQSVLFPQTIKLQPEEYESLIEITHYLEKIGFRLREFGHNTIVIEGIPPEIKWGNESKIIREIIDQFLSIKKISPTFIDQIAAIYACKSAIKAGDTLELEERIHLIDRLFSTQHPYYCPHGRPIIINLSIEELDKRFERIH